MTNVFKLIEEHGLTLHGDIEHFAELIRAEKQEQKTPLKVLNLTVFTENRLRNGRVYDVETLQALTNRDILAIPGMGKKALEEVLEALNAYAIDMSEKHVHESDKNRHEWVGLTDEEIKALSSWWPSYDQMPALMRLVRDIEAKLREKNHD